MIVAEELLEPISEEAPCGADLSYDASLQELETMARGKQETQFSAAEPPDWKRLHSRCLELFARSKDLRIVIVLSVATLELDGLPGFRESLALIKGLLERYWTAVHPQLDPADNNDPLQRINIVASMATPIGLFGDPLRVLERIRATPLCNSVQMGRYSLADILRAEAGTPGSDGKPAASVAQIDAAFRDSDPGELGEIHRVLGDCIVSVQEIDEFLMRTVGPASAPDLTPLSTQLVLMQNRVTPYLPAGASVGRDATTVVSTGSTAGLQRPLSITGEIRSREDVVRLLHKICEYYEQAEPSSPVPLVLKRAARLAEMDFMQIIKDMSPEAIAQIRTITGEADDNDGAAEQ
jgi:type VI secretion system protein ImpA